MAEKRIKGWVLVGGSPGTHSRRGLGAHYCGDVAVPVFSLTKTEARYLSLATGEAPVRATLIVHDREGNR